MRQHRPPRGQGVDIWSFQKWVSCCTKAIKTMVITQHKNDIQPVVLSNQSSAGCSPQPSQQHEQNIKSNGLKNHTYASKRKRIQTQQKQEDHCTKRVEDLSVALKREQSSVTGFSKLHSETGPFMWTCLLYTSPSPRDS